MHRSAERQALGRPAQDCELETDLPIASRAETETNQTFHAEDCC